jgi:alkane 1-monooxygenase
METAAHLLDKREHNYDGKTEINPADWRDSKRYAWLLGLLVPLGPLVSWGIITLTGFGGFWFAQPLVVFALFPILDKVLGMDTSSPPDNVVPLIEQDRYYRWCTYLYAPFQYASLILACSLWSSGQLSLLESLGLTLTVAIVGGIAIANAHELGHKREGVERWLSRIVLAQTGYGHFYIEHNRGHHVRVATPDDAASARMGEGFWAFWPRTVGGSFRSAWRLEAARLDRLGKSHWSLHNDLISAWAMTVVLFAALTVAFGLVVLPYLVLQAILGFSLLEVVNYVEHYGLLRQKMEDGRYQPCRPEHSWNSNCVASNVLLYHLQRHSDHHAYPTRRYQALRDYKESPQLPTGYAGMILLAMFPPLWRRVMDPRVVAHYGGDVTRANIQPSKRKQILARYGDAAKTA